MWPAKKMPHIFLLLSWDFLRVAFFFFFSSFRTPRSSPPSSSPSSSPTSQIAPLSFKVSGHFVGNGGRKEEDAWFIYLGNEEDGLGRAMEERLKVEPEFFFSQRGKKGKVNFYPVHKWREGEEEIPRPVHNPSKSPERSLLLLLWCHCPSFFFFHNSHTLRFGKYWRSSQTQRGGIVLPPSYISRSSNSKINTFWLV